MSALQDPAAVRIDDQPHRPSIAASGARVIGASVEPHLVDAEAVMTQQKVGDGAPRQYAPVVWGRRIHEILVWRRPEVAMVTMVRQRSHAEVEVTAGP
jgi:hypothetical protein